MAKSRKGYTFELETAALVGAYGMRVPRCFDESTLILTDNGFVGIDEINYGYKIATRNSDGYLEYHTASKIHVYDDITTLLNLKSGKSSFLFSAGHNLLVKRRHTKEKFNFINIDQFREVYNKYNYKACRTVKWDGYGDTNFFNVSSLYKNMLTPYKVIIRNKVRRSIKSVTELSTEFLVERHSISRWKKERIEHIEEEKVLSNLLFILGYYLGDGSISCNNKTVEIHEPDSKKQKLILYRLNNLGIKGSIYKENTRDYSFVTFNSLEFCKLLKVLGNTYGKFIPKNVKNLSKKLLKHLFAGLILSDGHLRNGKLYNYRTVSEVLASDVMEVGLKLGYAVNLGVEEAKDNRRKVYTVYINNRKKDVRFSNDASIDEVEYTGKVWGVTVPNSTVFIMRNGKTCWTGNSGAIGTTTGIAGMMGDVLWRFPWLDKSISIECKHGYSPPNQKAKSMSIKKEWFDKHLEQTKGGNLHPMFAMKLKFTAENGSLSKYFLIPFPTMKKIMEQVDDIYIELQEVKKSNERLLKKIEKLERK